MRPTSVAAVPNCEVTAAQVTMPKDQNTATVELTAAAMAPLGARGDVDVLGTIALGQQQSASPPFAVKVQAPTPVLTPLSGVGTLPGGPGPP